MRGLADEKSAKEYEKECLGRQKENVLSWNPSEGNVTTRRQWSIVMNYADGSR